MTSLEVQLTSAYNSCEMLKWSVMLYRRSRVKYVIIASTLSRTTASCGVTSRKLSTTGDSRPPTYCHWLPVSYRYQHRCSLASSETVEVCVKVECVCVTVLYVTAVIKKLSSSSSSSSSSVTHVSVSLWVTCTLCKCWPSVTWHTLTNQWCTFLISLWNR